MHRIDGTNAVAIFPTASPVGGVVGYFRKAASKAQATVLTSDWANSVQEEIVGVVLAGGLSLDKTDNTQLLAAINAIIAGSSTVAFAASAAAGSSVAGTVAETAVIIAAHDAAGGGPSAGGVGADSNAALACGDGSVAGTSTALIASNGGTLAGTACAMIATISNSDIDAAASRCTIVSADGADITAGCVMASVLASAHVEMSGSRSAIIACTGNTTDSDDVDLASGSSCVIMASDGAAARRTVISSSAQTSAIIASGNAEITGGTYQAVIASGNASATSQADITSASGRTMIMATLNGQISGSGTNAAILACDAAEISGSAASSVVIACGQDSGGVVSDAPDMEGEFSAFIGCDGDATITGANMLVLASSFGTAGVTIASSNQVRLYDGVNASIILDAPTGLVHCLALRVDNSSTSTAGPAPTLGNLPTGATDSLRWIKVSVDGAGDHWVPSWVA